MKQIKWRIALLLLLAAMIAAGICVTRYHIIDFHLYSKDARSFDLRGQDISLSHYQKLTRKFPDAPILWDVPFQGSSLANDTRELTVSSLTPEDAAILASCLPQLRTVNGRQCTDYDGLFALKQLRPNIEVLYWVPIGGTNYASTAMQIGVDSITREELDSLRYLPFLNTITVSGGEPELLRALRDYCREEEIALRLLVGGQLISENTPALKISGLTNDEAGLMYLLSDLKILYLLEPEADADVLRTLQKDLSGTLVTWEKTVFGTTYSQDVTQIDLTEVISLGYGQQPGDETAYAKSMTYAIQGEPEEVPSSVKLMDHRPLPDKTADTRRLIEEIEAAMAYFPQLETLVMCGSVLDNEAMAAFRERQQENYKVVWTVRCGKVATRTDASFFMPVKYHVYYLNDSEAYNLRYCPEMIAVDIGHMMVSDISFVEFMPNLKYLILAHTAVRNLEPIRCCKNLVFLEVDHTGVLDFSPLLDCTALEDLNIGNTWNEVEPLKEMTWLKNLWMVFRGRSAQELVEFLPDTNIVFAGSATVDSGWRDLPNYYAMRDELLMFYMSW